MHVDRFSLRTAALITAAAAALPPAARADMTGAHLRLEYRYPNIGTIYSANGYTARTLVVGSGVELSNWGLHSVDTDITTNAITTGFASGLMFSAASFNGWSFFDLNGTMPAIGAVTIDPNGPQLGGLTSSRITYDADHIWVNLQGLGGSGADGFRLIVATGRGGRWVDTGSTSNWADGGNWVHGAQPTSADDAVFDTSGYSYMGITADAVARNVNVSAGSPQFSFSPNKTLAAGQVNVGVRGTSASLLVFGSGRLAASGLECGYDFAAVNGAMGQGSLSVSSGADVVTTGNANFGHYGGVGSATVGGTGSTLASTGGSLFFGYDVANTGSGNAVVVGPASVGTLTVNAGGTVTAAQDVVIGAQGATGTATVSGTGALLSADRILVGDDVKTLNGTPYVSAGTLNLANAGRALASQVLIGAGGGHGVVNLSSGGVLDVSGVVTVRGVNSVVRLAGGTLKAASLDLGGDPTRLDWTGGTLQLDGGTTDTRLTVPAGGLLRGNATVHGDLTDHGTINPGPAGPLAIDGTLTGDGRFTFEINSRTAFDHLTAAAAILTAATIDVDLIGYVPADGDTFHLIDTPGPLAGTWAFDFAAAPLPAGLYWDTTAFASAGVLSVAVPEPTALPILAALALALPRRRARPSDLHAREPRYTDRPARVAKLADALP